jgi:glycosyltransferase involved in cell wall biosynthesis
MDIGLVISACESAGRNLVIVGAENLRDQIGPTTSFVRWESLPADGDLRSRIRGCRALLSVAPAGFDPALVEAQACGTPVIAYHSAATEEIVLDAERTGLGTGLFFHTLTARSLVSAIYELERRPQNISAVLSLAQAEKFSPAHFEHGLLNHVARWMSDRNTAQWKTPVSVPMPAPTDAVGAPRRRAA